MNGTLAINGLQKEWRQGDCVLGDDLHFYFVVAHNPNDDNLTEFDAEKVHGYMVTTQTCDVVREIEKQPYLDVCPVVDVSEQTYVEIKKGLRPRYLCIPAFSERLWVADLGRIQTVSKHVLVNWKRIPGSAGDEEIRGIQRGLARKVNRFAFPDDFNVMMQKLNDRFKKKHNKNSIEGMMLRGLKETRVLASPSWEADTVELQFWFLCDEPAREQPKLLTQVEKWLSLFKTEGRFSKEPTFIVNTYEDLSAKEYLSSDKLDLDYLSLPD